LAIFSADWPIDSPVDGSAIAGDTGIKSKLCEGLDARAYRLRLAGFHEDVGKTTRREDGNIGERLRAPRDHDVRVTQYDLIAPGRNGLRRGCAGAVYRVGGNLLRKLRQEADLAPDVGHERRGHDLAEDDFVDFVAIEVRALEQLTCRVATQIHGPCVFEDRAGFRERRSDAGNDCHATSVETGH
jgi:hypothetical protein